MKMAKCDEIPLLAKTREMGRPAANYVQLVFRLFWQLSSKEIHHDRVKFFVEGSTVKTWWIGTNNTWRLCLYLIF